jgi:hypothetical protein
MLFFILIRIFILSFILLKSKIMFTQLLLFFSINKRTILLYSFFKLTFLINFNYFFLFWEKKKKKKKLIIISHN